MPAPVAALTAFARTRPGRKALTTLIVLCALAAALLVAPIALIPLAIAGSTASDTVDTAAVEGPATGDAPVVRGEWGYPLAGSYATGRGFGWHPVKGCAYCPADHLGYDMDQPCGASIYAAGPGTVISAGPMPGWGNTVRIDHGDGLVTLYAHMAWDSQRVAIGDAVTAGTPLGAEGSTGKSTGCHLHFEVQVRGVAIDPEPFMAARGLPLR